MLYSGRYSSPIGGMTIVCHDEAVTGLWFDGQKYYLGRLPQLPEACEHHPLILAAKDWLDAYFAGKRPDSRALPLDARGSEFAQMIWALLREIPYGQTVTYGALARMAAERLGRARMSAQAVGGAVGHNPISIVIPCHRVLGSDGSLTGYAGGLDKKLYLLSHEGIDVNDGKNLPRQLPIWQDKAGQEEYSCMN